MRLCRNWIETYLRYYENTEPAKIFHFWTAVSMIAGALRKKTHLSLGRIKVFPNLYIVFVAEPGMARKTQAITFGLKFLRSIPDIVVSAESTTREALLQDLEASAQDEALTDGTIYRHCSLSIVSKEFETFLGQKKENNRMLTLLTDLYDCEEMPWKYRTKASGSNVIPSVFINLLAATTPDSLASSLPPTAIGGGLTSRILFVWADKREKKVPEPVETEEEVQLREILQKDLYSISRISGEYSFTPEARAWWYKWYNGYDESDPFRLCTDRSFSSWYSRKPHTILKVAICLNAAQSNSLNLDVDILKLAINSIESVESKMGNAFRGVGKSLITTELLTAVNFIQGRKEVHFSELVKLLFRDLDAKGVENVLDTAIRMGKIKRHSAKPNIYIPA